MGRKDSIQKNCIYLDQFAISDMIESKEGTLWFEIRKALESGHTNGLLFCPLSPEHFLETSQKSIDNAKVHNSFLYRLSDGFSLKSELFITSQLISSRIRNNNITIKTYMYDNVLDVFANESNYQSIDKLNKEFKYLISNATSTTNSIKKITNNQKIVPKEKESLINAVKTLPRQKFIVRLKELITHKNIVIRGDKIGEKEVPNWIDLIIDQLLKKHKFSKPEIEKLIVEFETCGFEYIPTLNIRTTLSAYSSIYSKQEFSNDHVDFMRIATGLPISDILLTDKKRKAELVESKLPEKYKTKVFSGVEKDLESLLKEICHLELRGQFQ